MRIDSDLWETSLHEARHSAYGSFRSMKVLAVHVTAYAGGHTDILLPFYAHHLRQHWEQDPGETTQQMRWTIGMICAPVAAEGTLFPGRCSDSDKLGSYAKWWGWLQPSAGVTPLPWLTLLAQARGEVRRWASAPGALSAQYELAYWLAQEGDVDAEGFAWLMRQPFTAPLRQVAPAVSTRPAAPRAPSAAVTKPKTYGVATPRPARPTWRPLSVHELPPVPIDWRTGGMPGIGTIMASRGTHTRGTGLCRL